MSCKRWVILSRDLSSCLLSLPLSLGEVGRVYFFLKGWQVGWKESVEVFRFLKRTTLNEER